MAAVVWPSLSRVAVTLPTATSPGQAWALASQATSWMICAADLDPAVIAVGGFGPVIRRGRRVVEQRADILKQGRLVALEREHIVAATVDDRLRRRPLAVHGVSRDGAAVKAEQRQQLRQGRDLAAVDLALAEDEPLLAAPGADHMEWATTSAPVERPPGGLAVDRHHLPDPRGERRDEAAEAGLERCGVEQAEQARERVVAGDATRQGEEPTQERLLRSPEFRHVDARLGTGQYRSQRDQHQLKQIVALRIARARIGQIRKARPKPLHPAPPEPFGAAQADPATKKFYKFLMRFPWPIGSCCPSISADPSFVGFVSSATNLVPGDTNGEQDVFIRRR